MDKSQAEKKINELSSEIELHNHNYYVDDKPTISDYEFDKLLEELIALEKEFPELVSIKPDKNLANIKAINYLEIIPLLVNKIQLMQKEIDELKFHFLEKWSKS